MIHNSKPKADRLWIGGPRGNHAKEWQQKEEGENKFQSQIERVTFGKAWKYFV